MYRRQKLHPDAASPILDFDIITRVFDVNILQDKLKFDWLHEETLNWNSCNTVKVSKNSILKFSYKYDRYGLAESNDDDGTWQMATDFARELHDSLNKRRGTS